MPASTIRIAGSGYTIFHWKGNPLLLCQTIQETAPSPVAQAVPIQAINEPHPTEIVTAGAVGAGTLRLTMYEKWDKNVWQDLPDFGDAHSLLDIFAVQIAKGAITTSKVILKPDGTQRVKSYQNCKIVDVDDGEQVNIASMVMPKGFTLMYTHYVYS